MIPTKHMSVWVWRNGSLSLFIMSFEITVFKDVLRLAFLGNEVEMTQADEPAIQDLKKKTKRQQGIQYQLKTRKKFTLIWKNPEVYSSKQDLC